MAARALTRVIAMGLALAGALVPLGGQAEPPRVDTTTLGEYRIGEHTFSVHGRLPATEAEVDALRSLAQGGDARAWLLLALWRWAQPSSPEADAELVLALERASDAGLPLSQLLLGQLLLRGQRIERDELRGLRLTELGLGRNLSQRRKSVPKPQTRPAQPLRALPNACRPTGVPQWDMRRADTDRVRGRLTIVVDEEGRYSGLTRVRVDPPSLQDIAAAYFVTALRQRACAMAEAAGSEVEIPFEFRLR